MLPFRPIHQICASCICHLMSFSKISSAPIWLSILAFALTSLLLPSKSSAQEDVDLSKLVSETKQALLLIEERWESEILKLDEVVLELHTNAAVSSSGEVSFYVVQAGGSSSTGISNTMILTLSPPPEDSGSDVASVNLANALAASILAAADAIDEASKGLPPLVAKRYQAEIRFTLEKKKGGGFSLNFPPFNFGGKSEVSNDSVHSITAIFSR